MNIINYYELLGGLVVVVVGVLTEVELKHLIDTRVLSVLWNVRFMKAPSCSSAVIIPMAPIIQSSIVAPGKLECDLEGPMLMWYL